MEGSNKKTTTTTTFFKAALSGDIEDIRDLIQICPEKINNVDSTSDRTALMIAVKKGYSSIVELLLNYKEINVDFQNKNGRHAFSLSVVYDKFDCFKLLLAHPSINVNEVNFYEITPLIQSIYRPIEYMRLLVEHKSIDLDLKDGDGESALSTSFCWSKHELVKLLLSKGAKVEDWKNWFGVGSKEERQETRETMCSWRSYLPSPWYFKTHVKCYPQEFKDLAIVCMMVWSKLEKQFKKPIPKDIKFLLIEYVAVDWRAIKD